jgi:eukaryotic-like serine/threonine-protein kinase
MTEITQRLSAALAGRYRLERHLGEGGMATVYLAHDLKHQRNVAVKVLRPELAAILGAERFLNEIKVTANLQHPSILPLYDSGEADSFLYYVMPHVEGESLRQKMDRERQLSVEDAVAIAKAVAAALQYAHERGIIHRDIKPENILLQSGQPLVADFGIALAVSQAGGTRLTETGLSLGTPHYMSPEQATGDRELDARSDLYSLGALTYEMLVGEPPHLGKSLQAIIAKILSERPLPITQSRDMVPANVEAAVMRVLAKSPADRFARAADFAAALTNPAYALPAAAGLAARPAAASARRPTAMLALGATTVLALALAGWALSRKAPQQPLTRVSVFLPTGQAFAGAATFDLSRDGASMVYEGPREGGGSQLWLRRWDALGAVPIRDTDGATGPTISPDGREVAFARGGAIRIVPLEGGVSRSVGVATIRCCVRWSADGAWLYFDHAEVGVGRAPASGGDAELLVQSRDWGGTQVSIYMDPLPNGRGIVFEGTKAVGGPWIMALDLGTGERKELTQGQFPRYADGHLLFATPDGGTLMAVPFDEGALEFRGAPLPVGEGLRPASGGWNYFAASQSGRLLYGAGRRTPGVYEIVSVTRDGQVTPLDPAWRFDPGDNNRGLALSPDGGRLAVTILEDGNYDIWIKQLPRGPASRLTFDPGQDVRPRWSPDGRVVTFLSDRGGRATSVYGSLATGTGGAELLLQDDQRTFWEAAYSPDGQWLLARTGGLATVAGGRDVWALRPGTDSAPAPLVVTEFDEKAIALSPDGRWLAYESDETGRNEVYVRPFPAVTEGKWQVSTGGGVMPRWAHSGRELFYVNTENTMVSAIIQPGSAFAVGDRRALFPLPAGTLFRQDEQYALYDVVPGDQRFVMMRAVARPDAGAERPELIMVEQWHADLRRPGAGR